MCKFSDEILKQVVKSEIQKVNLKAHMGFFNNVGGTGNQAPYTACHPGLFSGRAPEAEYVCGYCAHRDTAWSSEMSFTGLFTDEDK